MSEDIGEQTAQTFRNISAILEASGSSLERVLKVNIYLVDKADYVWMNEVYFRVRHSPISVKFNGVLTELTQRLCLIQNRLGHVYLFKGFPAGRRWRWNVLQHKFDLNPISVNSSFFQKPAILLSITRVSY